MCDDSFILTSKGVFLQGSFLSSITGPPQAALPWRGLPADPPHLRTWLPGAAPPGPGALCLHSLPTAVIDNCPLPTNTRCRLPSSQSCFTWSMTGLLENQIQVSPSLLPAPPCGEPPQTLFPTEDVSRTAPGKGHVPAMHKQCQTKADVKMSLKQR